MLRRAFAAFACASPIPIPVAKQLRALSSRGRRDHQARPRRSLTTSAAAPVTAMPGRAKASSVCGPDQPEDLEGSRGAKAGAVQEEADGGDGGAATAACEPSPNQEIVKSPSDPKQYRYIKLQNGLCVLLISDLNNPDGSPCPLSSEGEGDSEEDTDEDEDSGAEIEDDQEGYDDECGGYDEDLDDPDSELEELGDKEETRKRNCTEKQSAAALCIGVGSFSDPEDLPGLAHFLEHMVFMGSSKYPDENGFDAFLKKHGGSDNASTDCERTIFQFDVQRKYFKEALDRWAQFFIHPLMIRDAIDREVEAVDSEYQLARPSDVNRREMLFGSLARSGHPMKKFFWGNADTLKHEPKQNDIDTYTRLREFWQRYYSAHYMTLVVQSKETLDILEKWVTEIFSEIPNNDLPRPIFGHLTKPFDTPDFHKLYRVVPIRKTHSLNITWALPPQEQHYRVKPLHYISWLVGHEGKGSVLSFLRKKFWALALYGGNGETGFEQNSTYSVFSICVTLTDEGYKHFYEVAHVVFQYLKMLQQTGPEQRIWEEIQKIEANEFHYQEQTDPVEYVESLCENMQLFPKEDILTGDQLLFEYKPEVIAEALHQLSPQQANLILLSAAHEGQCHLKERWFGTQYSAEDIDKHWSDIWASDFMLNPDLHLPEENRYIATDFSLKAPDCPQTEYPLSILSTQQGCLWYKKDDKFKIPKAYIRFHLISPLIQQSAENLVLFDTFVNILAHNLAEPAYEADVAQLEYKLVAGEHGLIVRVRGFNHKLPLLFQLIIDHLADFSFTPEVFEMITEQLKKTYFNILIKPETLAKDVRLLILEHGRWSMTDKYETLMKGLSLDSLLLFVKAFKSQLFAEGLVQGNFTSSESKEFLHYVVEKLQFLPLVHPCPVQFQVMNLPSDHLLCKVKTLNKGDANSEVTVYYQSGARNIREYSLMELLVMYMEEPCFDFLRTKQTLGYHVYPTCRNTSGILGFSVTVATQATKYNSELVDGKIEEFLSCFDEKIKHMTEEAFNTQVTALIKLKECEDSHLGEEVDRNWSEVVTQQYLFDRLVREIEALKSLSQSELVAWFQAHRGKERKVLSVHVVGFGIHEGDVESSTPSNIHSPSCNEIPQLMFLDPSSMTDATCIKDIKIKPKWQKSHPSNNTAARLQKLIDSDGDNEESDGDSKMVVKAGTEPGSHLAIIDELREMLTCMKEAIFKRIEEQAEKINKRIDQLATEIAHNDKQIKSLKTEEDQLEKQVQQMEEKHVLEYDEHEKRLIFWEDQNRRSSVRVRNLAETPGEDLRKMLLRWFKELVLTLEIGEDDVERVHRVGGFRRGSTPRDILLKFSNYFKKEQLMGKLRSLAELKFQGVTVQVYNDLCQQTINWRRSVKPITAELKRRSIKYAWGYPVFLRFMYDGKHYRVSSLKQGMELLQSLDLDPRDGVGSKDADSGEGGAATSGK